LGLGFCVLLGGIFGFIFCFGAIRAFLCLGPIFGLIFGEIFTGIFVLLGDVLGEMLFMCFVFL